MRTLYRGLRGDDVLSWEYFLLGQEVSNTIVADGFFDDATYSATIAFQIKSGINKKNADGIVGPITLSKALEAGFNPLTDDDQSISGKNWPPAPSVSPMSPSERENKFGRFSYVAAPTSKNPEAIKITDNWAKNNIVQVKVPQLSRLGVTKVNCHDLVAKQFVSVFADWEKYGLTDRILTWNGSWVARFIRGSRSNLSNHSWGTAFDINASWNRLGMQPTLRGQEGSVRELVTIALGNGFYWGGWFGYNKPSGGRPDGMHFEIYDVR